MPPWPFCRANFSGMGPMVCPGKCNDGAGVDWLDVRFHLIVESFLLLSQ